MGSYLPLYTAPACRVETRQVNSDGFQVLLFAMATLELGEKLRYFIDETPRISPTSS